MKNKKMKFDKLSSEQVEKLFRERLVFDFPKDEVKPLDIILEAMDKGIYECLGLMDENDIIGYVFLVKKDKDYLIDYLAVYPDKRNSGIGSKMLKLLAEYYMDVDNIILEIEDPDRAENPEEKELQIRRRVFYLRNNCKDTGLRIDCFGVPFQILIVKGNRSEDLEYLKELYVSFYKMVLPENIFEKNSWDFI